jgi:hypothetical protein
MFHSANNLNLSVRRGRPRGPNGYSFGRGSAHGQAHVVFGVGHFYGVVQDA